MDWGRRKERARRKMDRLGKKGRFGFEITEALVIVMQLLCLRCSVHKPRFESVLEDGSELELVLTSSNLNFSILTVSLFPSFPFSFSFSLPYTPRRLTISPFGPQPTLELLPKLKPLSTKSPSFQFVVELSSGTRV